jgi:hypothetical protein
MKRFLGLAFAVTLAASPFASAQSRDPAPPVAAPVAPPASLQQQTPAPAPGLCCCRVWSHGWQYSWLENAACTTANGTCVSPDHC